MAHSLKHVNGTQPEFFSVNAQVDRFKICTSDQYVDPQKKRIKYKDGLVPFTYAFKTLYT